MEEKIRELIEESEEYTFYICSDYNVDLGETYSLATPELVAWTAECEDFILANYGKESTPWKVFEKFERDQLGGNYEGTFNKQIEIIKSALTACLRIQPKRKAIKSAKQNNNVEYDKVFVVHGHDEEAKVRVARYLEKLNLKPIILHEQASSGKTIIEKIESYSNVGFAIVLYTPCDIGSKQSKAPDLKPRARQNVVFEHGFLMGKIGRNNVCALVKGDIETPNDISGIVYVNMDSNDAWQFQLAKELKKSNYNIDLNKLA